MGIMDIFNLAKGKKEPPPNLSEIGNAGLNTFSGNIQEAYSRNLTWPSCVPLYNRIWRSDPEVGMARLVLNTLANQVKVGVELPDYAMDGTSETPISDDDRRAKDFLYTVIEDMGGGSINQWLSDVVNRVPFFGWGYWEIVWGLRDQLWTDPSAIEWDSRYDDKRIGVRKLGFRSYNSFDHWEIDPEKQQTTGMWQVNPSTSKKVLIPRDKAVHIRWGDIENPEGLATLEAIYRLERIKYNLELVMGMGFEHSAGYLDVVADKNLTEQDKSMIKKAARSIMTAQEGNYALWPQGFKAELKDVPFSVAPSLNEAIRYYGILKLALLGLQWSALGTLSPFGSYTTIRDASGFFIMTFNAMLKNFIDQLDQQLVGKLFRFSPNQFPGMTRRPKLAMIGEVQKTVPLSEMAQFIKAIETLIPLGEEDFKSIKKASGFLPEAIGEDAKLKEVQQPQPFGRDPEQEDDDETEDQPIDDNEEEETDDTK